MKCRYCYHNGMIVTRNGLFIKCTWCGNTEKYKSEPLEEVYFIDIKTFVSNLDKEKFNLLKVPEPMNQRDRINNLWEGE